MNNKPAQAQPTEPEATTTTAPSSWNIHPGWYVFFLPFSAWNAWIFFEQSWGWYGAFVFFFAWWVALLQLEILNRYFRKKDQDGRSRTDTTKSKT